MLTDDPMRRLLLLPILFFGLKTHAQTANAGGTKQFISHKHQALLLMEVAVQEVPIYGQRFMMYSRGKQVIQLTLLL